tara:strand:- start:382 stop:510 length:129 start_codon:yes stop_codon:yes gene_type:complete
MPSHSGRVIQPVVNPVLLRAKPTWRNLSERILVLIRVVVLID